VGSLILGAEVTAIYRSRHRAPAAPSEATIDEPQAPAAAPPPIADPRPATPAPAPRPPIAAAPPAEEPRPAAPIDGPLKRPLFVAPEIETVIRTADETVFQELGLPEATREAIRRLNEEHEHKLHLLRAGYAGTPTEQQLQGSRANIAAFKQTRRDALQELLGADTEIRFERAERAATKHLHNQFRVQSLGGVSPSVPAPSAQ
jgi:hypothetical protein